MKNTVSVAIATLMINFFSVAPPWAAAQSQSVSLAEKVKAAVLSLGTGKQTSVEIKTGSHTIVRGSISEAKESEMVVLDRKSGMPIAVPYSSVESIKGRNSDTGARISVSAADQGGRPSGKTLYRAALIGAAVALGVIVVVAVSSASRR